MLFLFYGEESYAPRAAVRALTEKFLTKNPSGAGLSRLDCAEGADLATVRAALFAHSLFTERRLVVVENPWALPAADQRELAAVMPQIAADDVVVLWHRGAVRADSVLLRAVTAVAHTVKAYPALTSATRAAWTASYVRDRGITMEPAAVQLLVERLASSDATHIALTCDLLAAFATESITTADVTAMVPAHPDIDVFDVVAAATSGNRQQAMMRLQDALDAGEDPIRLFGLYVYGIRTMLAVADAATRVANPAAIAAATGLKPFVVNKSRDALRRSGMTVERLLAAHDLLVALDRDIKTGVCDPSLALTRLVARL